MEMEEKQIGELVEKAKKGDQAAFEELYSVSFRQTYFICISFLGNAEDAKDVMQDVYITAYEKLSSLKDDEKFIPWVNRIAVNNCKKLLLKKSVVFTEIENASDGLMEENENFLPEEYITQKEKRKIVMDIMKNTLSDIQYKTVILYYFNGLTIDEIADIMECPPGTVKYRLSVARAKIRDGVGTYENKSGDKLYSVMGLPLLMRLLHEEANSIDVPDLLHDIMEAVSSHFSAGQIECADAASNANPASADQAAKITKGGKIIKMTKSSKVIIAATAAVIIIGGVTTAVITANQKNPSSPDIEISQQDPSDEETVPDTPPASFNTETVSDNQSVSSNAEENIFWLHTADWGEEKDLTGISLFNGECTTPINLNDFDGDERLAPYQNFTDESYYYSDNLTELFYDDQIIDYEETMFVPQCNYEALTTIDRIYLCNYTEEDISLQQAYKNNWFVVAASDISEEFNIDDGDASFFERDIHILNAVIQKYGRPSYLIADEIIYTYDEEDNGISFFDSYQKNVGSLYYDLIWEREDFVLILRIRESIYDGIHQVNIREGIMNVFLYVSKELWPDYLEYHYTYYEDYYKIYDLDDLK